MKPSFSLLEIVFVIIVISILVVVALPKFSAGVDSAKISKLKSDLVAIRSSISSVYNKNVISGNDACPVLEKSTSDNTLFENVMSSPIVKNQKLKWDGNGTDYNATVGDVTVKFSYQNTPEAGCSFKCIDNCDVIGE